MKEVFVGDILHSNVSDMPVELSGWISAKRDQGKVIFLDVCDSTGKIQVVVAESNVTPEIFHAIKHWPIESAVTLKGLMTCPSKSHREIVVVSIALVSGVTKDFSPHPRGKIDIFDESMIPHLLKNRHMYIRNPRVMAILLFHFFLEISFEQILK